MAPLAGRIGVEDHWEIVLHMTGFRTNSERMDAVYKSHFTAIRAYCMRRLPVSAANDAVAEVFLTAWRRIEDLPFGDGELSYLYGIARNKVFHARRSSGRRSRLAVRVNSVAPDRVEGPEAIVMAKAEADAVDRAMAALRPLDREIIQLRAWEELTGPQLADVLGISLSAAQKRLSRALARLATELGMTRSIAVPARRRKEVNDD